MKKIILLLLLPMTVSANHKSLFTFCDSLEEGLREVCLMNSEYVWKDVTEDEVTYCSNFEDNQSDNCLKIAGCTEHKPQSVMECLIDLSEGIEKPCSFEAVRVYVEASKICAQRSIEAMEEIQEDWGIWL